MENRQENKHIWAGVEYSTEVQVPIAEKNEIRINVAHKKSFANLYGIQNECSVRNVHVAVAVAVAVALTVICTYKI